MDNKKFFSEVTRKLSKLELTTESIADDNLSVFMDGKQLCNVTADTDVLYQKDFACTEARRNMLDTVNAETVLVHEYLTAMESAPPLVAEGLGDGYKLLCEFNGTVLAGKDRDKFGLQFITWDRDGGRGLNYGHYFEGSYLAAKEDFAQRAELVDRHKLFTQDQIVEMYRCITDTLESRDLSVNEQEILDNTQRQIERLIPDIKDIITEKIQQDTAQQFNM